MLLHYKDGIFYLVRVCIALHNMMVKVWVEDKDIMEESTLYDINNSGNDHDSNKDCAHDDVNNGEEI